MVAWSNDRSWSRTGSSTDAGCTTTDGTGDPSTLAVAGGPTTTGPVGVGLGPFVAAGPKSVVGAGTTLAAGSPGQGRGLADGAEPAAKLQPVTSARSRPASAVRAWIRGACTDGSGRGVRGRTDTHGTLDGHVPPRTGVQG
jgi:hypothetical protein